MVILALGCPLLLGNLTGQEPDRRVVFVQLFVVSKDYIQDMGVGLLTH